MLDFDLKTQELQQKRPRTPDADDAAAAKSAARVIIEARATVGPASCRSTGGDACPPQTLQ